MVGVDIGVYGVIDLSEDGGWVEHAVRWSNTITSIIKWYKYNFSKCDLFI